MKKIDSEFEYEKGEEMKNPNGCWEHREKKRSLLPDFLFDWYRNVVYRGNAEKEQEQNLMNNCFLRKNKTTRIDHLVMTFLS